MAKHIHILDLRPTELALGMLEVKVRVKQLGKLNRCELKKQVKKCRVSVVIAPNGRPYFVDGHHHACVFWMLGIKKVFLHIREDLSESTMSYERFWREMKKRGRTHLYDQFGKGPHAPLYLPEDIRGLGDDPYRSLAWLVCEKKGFKKTTEPYAHFQWAGFFRKHRFLHHKYERDFVSAMPTAIKLAESKSASHLPGYVRKTKK